jgi:predicted permease
MTPESVRRRYRRLLKLAPARLRVRHAAEMEEAFLDEWRRARDTGRIAAAWTWCRAGVDLALARIPRRSAAAGPLDRPFSRLTSMIGTDIRSAIRSLRRQPLGTVLVIGMLALGIAANVTIFSLVDALFLRPFPFPQADRLVYMNEKAPKWNLEYVGINFPDFWQWRNHATLFEAMAAFDDRSFNLSDEQNPERIEGAMATRDFARVLGVEPLVGRVFNEQEDQAKGPHAVILSERLWRERFHADPNIAGQTLRLNGEPWTIVGVLPTRAQFPGRPALWVPYQGDINQNGESYAGDGIGRLKPGVSIEQAEADLLHAHEAVWAARDKNKVVSPFLRPLRSEMVQDARTSVPTLAAAVALLLIVACANVASVMLARAIARRREIGIRLAIGAARSRLVRQLFVENLVLSVAGAVIGTLAGRATLNLLVSTFQEQVPRWADFSLDLRVVAFSAGLAVATALLFGSAPAWHAVRGNLRGAMSDSSSGSTISPRGRRTLTWLVAAEFTLAAVLIVGGGLLYRAFDKVRGVDPGFRADHVLMFKLALPAPAYLKDEKRLAFWDDLLTRVRAQPGVTAAGVVNCPPLDCHWGYFYKIEGEAPRGPNDSRPVTLTRIASEGYDKAMGLELRQGRFLDAADRQTKGPRVVVVNEAFVKAFWPSETNVVGKRISFNNDTPDWIPVVGVVKDVRHYGFEKPMRPGVYFPMSWPRTDGLAVAIRTTGDPSAFTTAARHIVHEIDPELPLYRVRTMEEAVAQSMRSRALYSWLLAIFAGLALMLALGGTYGVTSYLVGQRTREIGIRLAMGAGPRDIFQAVLRTSATAVLIGGAVGGAAAVALGRWLGDLLFGVSPGDPLVLVAAAAALAVAAILANWIPARRAARTDPMISLKA